MLSTSLPKIQKLALPSELGASSLQPLPVFLGMVPKVDFAKDPAGWQFLSLDKYPDANRPNQSGCHPAALS